ncbi:MAG TPA: PsiF family protein [Usitatibacter sp.]|nr:PsiF family protein [Usitatibacter sp.]
MRFTAAFAAAAALIAFAAFADEATHKQGTQQTRFATCAHESKGLRGEEHQKFMSECLKGHETDGAARKEPAHRADETGAQQNRMRACNEEAGRKALHGDERRAFMSTCLKG